MDLLMLRRRAMMKQSGTTPYLPYDAEIEYIESDGHALIDCGFLATDAIALELDFGRVNNDIRIDAGAEAGWTSNIARFIVIEGGITSWRRGASFPSSGDNIVNGNFLVGKSHVETLEGLATITNKSTGETYSKNVVGTTPFITPSNFILFAASVDGAIDFTVNKAGARLYKAHITDANVNLDFIPVRVGSVGYLYDRNGSRLYGNAGGEGAFILGPDMHYPETDLPRGATAYDYIQNDGTQYIDTGYGAGVNPANLRMDFDTQFLSDTPNYSWTVFADMGSSKYFGVQMNGITVRMHQGSVVNSGYGLTTKLGAMCSSNYFAVGRMYYGFTLSSFVSNIFLYYPSNPAKGRLWRTKMMISGVLVRDYQPCTDPNGRAAMYDYVSKQYFYGDNISGNDFTVGND